MLGQLDLARLLAGDRAQRRGCALAQAEARRRVRTRWNLRACELAREIGADVQHVRRPLLERDQRVEARDAVRVGGRNVEPARRVAERALAHPADAALRGAQRGKQELAAVTPRAADPAVRVGCARDRVDRGALGVRRLRLQQLEIHQSGSTRIAVALNSAVPDFGSVASIVRMFVATSSGKWRFMNARPGRSVSS